MSSRHSRNAALAAICLILAICGFVSPGHAQDTLGAQQGAPPERIDILSSPPAETESDYQDCKDRKDIATISGEIVVCREKVTPSPYRYSSKDKSQDRYAASTAFRDDPATPDVAGPGIFQGPATVSNLCIPGLQKCPPPPALFIDVSALPQAPPGSDADRIAHGLPPTGNDGEKSAHPALSAERKQELGLPDPSAVRKKATGSGTAAANSTTAAPALSPAESAKPAGQP